MTCRACGAGFLCPRCDGIDAIATAHKERDSAEARAVAALDQRDALEAAARVFLTEEGLRCHACQALATVTTQAPWPADHVRQCDGCPPGNLYGWTELPQAALVRLLGERS